MSISQRLHDLLNLGYTYTNKLFDIYLKFRSKCASCFYLLTRQLCFPALLSGASGTLHTPSPGQVYRGAVTLRAKRAGPSLGFGSSLHTGVLLLVVLARGCAQAVLVLRREVSSDHCCEGRSQQVDLGRACPAGGQAGGTGRPVAVTGGRGLGGQADAGSRLEQSGTHWVVLSRAAAPCDLPCGKVPLFIGQRAGRHRTRSSSWEVHAVSHAAGWPQDQRGAGEAEAGEQSGEPVLHKLCAVPAHRAPRPPPCP